VFQRLVVVDVLGGDQEGVLHQLLQLFGSTGGDGVGDRLTAQIAA
jgi:hypothetical protein